MLLPAKPMARMVAISRERSETAEYMVLSAPKTAPMPMMTATRVPSTVIKRGEHRAIAARSNRVRGPLPRSVRGSALSASFN